jgi:hypothetical protein
VAGGAELERLIGGSVPEDALRFFARWWQFETYLREVVYLELRARDGSGYEANIDGRTLARARADEKIAYMASADLEALTYLDAGHLLELIDTNWRLFEDTLLPQERWRADAGLIKTLRNRVSHCRRPHGDDLGRLLQLLRDLEHGARIFYSSAVREDVDIPARDPMAKQWIKGRHEVAGRLLDHARRQYDTSFRLGAGRRPWAATEVDRVSGSAGYVWHANWILGSRELRAEALWRSVSERTGGGERIVHLLMPSPFQATATFAAVDDVGAVADTIGAVFDSVLETSVPTARGLGEDSDWGTATRELPAKVQTYTPLALYDPYNPFSIFGAGDR